MQLAKAFGAEVTGVCSTAKTDLVRSIGADHVIDYTQEDFADGRQHYDLILDIGGNSRLSRLRRALTPTGTLVIAGGEGAKWTGVGRQLRALALSPVVPPAADHVHLPRNTPSRPRNPAPADRSRPGHPLIGQTYPLAEVPEAIRHLQAGHAQERSPSPSEAAFHSLGAPRW